MKKKIVALFTTGLLIISANSLTSIASTDSYSDDLMHMVEDTSAEITITNNRAGNLNSRVFVGKSLTSIDVTSLSSGSLITTRDEGLSIDPDDTPTNKVGVEYSSNVSRQSVGICYYDPSKGEYVSEGSVTTSWSSGAVSFNVKYKSGVNHYAFVKDLSGSTMRNSEFSFIGM